MLLPDVEKALEAVLVCAERIDSRVLLVGAWARDLCLPEACRGEPRKTRDADLAVHVESWQKLDDLFDAVQASFDVRRADLTLRHRHLGVKVDVVPCGRIETPRGQLHLRGSSRVLNLVGLAASFDSAEPWAVRSRTVLVPRPSAFVLLKLLSYLDRRAPRDLRDLGYVARRRPYDVSTIWDDPATRRALADQVVLHEDLSAWFLGRDLVACFEPHVVQAFRDGLDELAEMDLWPRSLLADDVLVPRERIVRADRMIRTLRASVSEPQNSGS